MRAQTVMATNTPIREQPAGTYTCKRCGIVRGQNHSRVGSYCKDCKPYVKAMS